MCFVIFCKSSAKCWKKYFYFQNYIYKFAHSFLKVKLNMDNHGIYFF